MPALSPHHAFVLAAMRDDARGTAELAAAAERVRDWSAVAALAIRHDVAWWARRALPPSAPVEVRRALDARVLRVAEDALAGTRALVELFDALHAAGVRAVAYKGPALSMAAHGDLGARRFTDLDVLVSGGDREPAERALLTLGYQPRAGYREREARFYARWEGVSHFERPGAGLPVELHWRVQAPRYGAPQDPAPIVATAQPCALAGRSVPAPSPEALAVLLAVHGTKHAWTSLMWVADFAATIRRPGFDWERFADVASAWHARRAAHVALVVAEGLHQLDLPAAWSARARQDAAAARLADELVRALLSDEEQPNAGREGTPRHDLRWLDGPRARLRYLLLAALLPTPEERRLLRLPDVLLPLAVPLRVARLAWRAITGRR